MTQRIFTEPSGQTKLNKALIRGYLQVGIHLAPHTLSGWNMCPFENQCAGP